MELVPKNMTTQKKDNIFMNPICYQRPGSNVKEKTWRLVSCCSAPENWVRRR